MSRRWFVYGAALLTGGWVLVQTGVLNMIIISVVLAHGDMQPQPVDTTGLEPLGKEWKKTNPYRGSKKAIEIGSGGYNQNCARCHGLEAKSGGLAPDLRFLEEDEDGDEWYVMRVRQGMTQNGLTKMPKFEDILSQEALWAIRAYIDSLPEDD